MIERYIIKGHHRRQPQRLLKKLEEKKDFSFEELRKLQHLKVKIEVICEMTDFKETHRFPEDSRC